MHNLEVLLSPNGLEALKNIRALRALPECDSTYYAERSALKSINISDIKRIARILADERERNGN